MINEKNIQIPPLKEGAEALLAWAAQPHDADALEDTLDSLAHEKGGQMQIEQAFSLLLREILSQNGYSGTPEEMAQKLARDIPTWQDPERTLPYHPLLVRSWLGDPAIKTHYLPEVEAWEGIRYYLEEASKSNNDQHILTTMDSLFTAASMNNTKEVRDATQRIVKELGTHTTTDLAKILYADDEAATRNVYNCLFGRCYPSADFAKRLLGDIESLYDDTRAQEGEREGLKQLELALTRQQSYTSGHKAYPYISELQRTAKLCVAAAPLSQKTIAETLGLNDSPFNQRLSGKTRLSVDDTSQLDAILNPYQPEGAPSHTQLALYDLQRQSEQRWQETEGFGQTLRAWRESVLMSQAETAKAFGILRILLSFWENETIVQKSPCCPSSTQLDALIDILSEKQAALKERFGNDFTSLMDDAKIQILRYRWQKLHDQSEKRCTAKPVNTIAAKEANLTPLDHAVTATPRSRSDSAGSFSHSASQAYTGR